MHNILLALAYLIGLVGGVWFRVTRTRTFRERKKPVPVGEKMLRSPGESLSTRVEKKTEDLLWLFSGACLLPVVGIVSWGAPAGKSIQTWQFAFIALALFAFGYLLSTYLTKRLLALSNVFLGLKGERLVGEMLNRLMKDGYDVFHDYPIEPDGRSVNIDHVVVGPTGIFAVETKTHRKPKEAADGKNYEVSFDGKQLKFPHFTTRKGIDQSVHNARLLAKHLGASLDEKLEVTPILALPGWFVSSQRNDPLLVRNPKNIRASILGRNEIINESLQKKIAYQLELRCRDVEF
jgi:hypothetical protein